MADDKITHLKPVHVVPGQPNPDIIRNLEMILEDAKAGLITDITVATVHSDGDTGSFVHMNGNWAKLIGATEYAKHRVIQLGE